MRTSARSGSRSVAQTYTAGQAFVEDGPTDENLVRNDGSVPAETIVTLITRPARPSATTPRCPPGTDSHSRRRH